MMKNLDARNREGDGFERNRLFQLRLPRGRSIEMGEKPVLMGIVNLTPDSFYAPSRRMEPMEACDRALALLDEGAAIIDFGAESTRPGSAAISADEEIARLLPVLEKFRARSDAVVSVDTYRASTARAALQAGADIINDIQALSDPDMGGVLASFSAAVVLMHMKGEPATMQKEPFYSDCAVEVRDFLVMAARRALNAGVPSESIVLDPGIGFGKNLDHNLDLLRRLYLLSECGYPVLVGMSRKSFIGQITGKQIQERLGGSLGASCAAWMNGADILRVHDVAVTWDVLKVFMAVAGATRSRM
jgi:dihydropteroate synthase